MRLINKEKIIEILLKVRSEVFRFKMQKEHKYLAKKKREQKKAFSILQKKIPVLYENLKKYDISKYTTPLWEKYNTKLENIFLPSPPFSFLKNPTIMFSMFMTAGGKPFKEELTYLEKNVSHEILKKALIEDYVGNPLLLNAKYLTSHNTVHHLYHLTRFIEKTKHDFDKMKTIIEWGGGYGNLIKLIRRLKRNKCTYIIIDLPLFSCLQWLYLSTIFGEKNINLIQKTKASIKPNKINLVPLCFLDNFSLKTDLLISTWALSESSKYSQNYVVNKNWFGAKHMLLAFQDSCDSLPDATRVGKLAEKKGAIIESIDFLPGNHYAFL